MSETNRFSYSSFGSNEQSGTAPTDREELLRRMKAQEEAAARQAAQPQQSAAAQAGGVSHEEAIRQAQAQREAAQRRMLEQAEAQRRALQQQQAQQTPSTAQSVPNAGARQAAQPGAAQVNAARASRPAARGTAQTVTFGEDNEQMLRDNRDRARTQAHQAKAAEQRAAGQPAAVPGPAPLTAQERAAAKAAAKERRATGAAQAKSAQPTASPRKKAARNADTATSGGGRPPKAPDDKKKKKSNKKAIIIAVSAVAALLVIAGTLFALSYMGILNFQKEQFYTYDVPDSETLVKYLQHPALKAGDTLNVTGSCTVDVVETFGDMAVLPLVNFTGSGSVTFEGGSVLFAGDEKSSTLRGLQFSDCDVYIEAGKTNLTWDSPVSDDNINAATLNGAAHTRALSLLFVGARTTVPVILENSGGALSNVEIKLTSASCIFPDGDTYIVESLASGSSVIDVPVVITEGGRIQVSAFGTDAGGNTVVTGQSEYIHVAGDGYYAGDLHTHTSESIFEREATLDANIRYGFQNGMSFIFSVENRESPDEDEFATKQEDEARRLLAEKLAKEQAAADAAKEEEEETTEGDTTTTTDPATNPDAATTSAGGSNFLQLSSETLRRQSLPVMLATTATTDNTDTADDTEDTTPEESVFDLYPGDDYIAEQLDQSAVDSITGAPGEFLQIAAVETGYSSQHMLIYGANLAPPSDYGDTFHISDYVYGTWTFQEALDAVLEGNGIVILPHVISRDATQGIQHAFSLDGMTAMEVVSIGQKADETGGVIERNIWNCINTRGFQKLFAVMSSNNYSSSEVGTSFIEGHMNTLSESAIYDLLRSGEFIATNGPEVRFTLGGHVMGDEIVLPQLAESAENADGEAQDGEAASTGTKVKARIYAADDAPLTEVKLLRYTITKSIDNVLEEVVFSQSFQGGVYSFTTEVELELNPGEFYRVEVRSATSDLGDDIGLGLSNPIWVSDERMLQNSTNIESISLKGGAELMTAPNGTYYIKADRFNAGMIDVLTDGKATSVTYHHYSSDLIADKVTIQITASDASQTTETIYLVK